MKILLKLAITCLLIVSILGVSACTAIAPNTSTENIVETAMPLNYVGFENYYFKFKDYYVKQVIEESEKNIIVMYPQLIKFGNYTESDTVNEMIKSDILAFVNEEIAGYSEESIAKGSLVCDYVIRYGSEQYISIEYNISYYFGGVYPVEILHTINIDLKENKKLLLGDVVDLSEEFDEKFYKSVYDSIEWEVENYIFSGHLNENTDFYFDDYNFTICLKTIQVAGFHMEFNIRNTDMTNYIKDTELFNELTDFAKTT